MTTFLPAAQDIFSPLFTPSGVNIQEAIFPSALNYTLGFSTFPYISHPSIQYCPLSDEPLGVHAVFSRTKHPIVSVPNGSYPNQVAWEASFPAGSINPSCPIPGGFGFYLNGPTLFGDLLSVSQVAQEVVFGYSVLFEEGWEWAKGGKLPGIYGGVGNSAYGCTGGRDEDRDTCFDLRLMWRSHGQGEIYAYVPPSPSTSERLLAVQPHSVQNPDYGFSVGRGSFSFAPGKWTVVMQRVKLNDIGQSNGEIELRIDNATVIHVPDLLLRTSPDFTIQGLHFQTFFGGNKSEWASPKNQKAWFSDISGAIVKQPNTDPFLMLTGL